MSGMVRAAQHYLKVLGRSEEGSEKWLPALAEALDRIALAQHRAPEGAPAKSRKKPRIRIDLGSEKEAISSHFLSHGYYTVVPPTSNIETDILMANAVDDIEEIAREMKEFLWRAENINVEDACWHAHLTVGHWGRHLLGLRSYLHQLIYDW